MAQKKDKNNELRTWYKKTLEDTVKEMVKTKAVTGAAIEAVPMWTVPFKILIAKVWDATQKSQFVWTIAGEDAVTDHIPGPMAANPQEAARHFAMKWQLDAERLQVTAKDDPKARHRGEVVGIYTDKLVAKAEALYDLATQDEIWKRKIS